MFRNGHTYFWNRLGLPLCRESPFTNQNEGGRLEGGYGDLPEVTQAEDGRSRCVLRASCF